MAEYRQFRFAPPPGSTRLLLVRHGESAAFEDDKPFTLVDGHGDPPLRDPDGLEHAACVAERLADEDITAIYVTPLQRTAQTAAPLAERLGIEPRVERELREVHLGEWEAGGLRKATREGHELIPQIISEQRWDVIPGAEPTDGFDARVREGIERIAAAHPDETVAVFVHGGVIGRVLATAVGAERGLAFAASDNGSISEIVVTAEGMWLVRRFNDTAHLQSRPEARQLSRERRPDGGKW